MNQKVKNLIQKLGEAIHESVSESEDIAGVVKNIREQGFDVLLMLEATIGLNEVETEAEESNEPAAEDADGPFTRQRPDLFEVLAHQPHRRRNARSAASCATPAALATGHHRHPGSLGKPKLPMRPAQLSAGPHFFMPFLRGLLNSISHGRLAFLYYTRVALRI